MFSVPSPVTKQVKLCATTRQGRPSTPCKTVTCLKHDSVHTRWCVYMNSTDSVYRRNSFSESDFQTARHAIGVALVENGPEFCLRIAAKSRQCGHFLRTKKCARTGQDWKPSIQINQCIDVYIYIYIYPPTPACERGSARGK